MAFIKESHIEETDIKFFLKDKALIFRSLNNEKRLVEHLLKKELNIEAESKEIYS